jgi:predicted NBD/HSP70 family sugar kinase
MANEKILVIDVGGTHIKLLATGQTQMRRFDSGINLTPQDMVKGVLEMVKDWSYNAITIGFPSPVKAGKIALEPHNLGRGWVGFDFERAFGCPIKYINDASMQALGSYEGGKMLFLGLGTGLGSTLIADGTVLPMELGHLPFKKDTFEDYIGQRGLDKYGKKKWRELVPEVIAILSAALLPDYVVLGGGNTKKLEKLPEGVHLGSNDNAFKGGFRLWENASSLEKAKKKEKNI